MATKEQIKAIHAAKAKTGLDDEAYREMLWNMFEKRSSKDLTTIEAHLLIEHLTGVKLAFKPTKKSAQGKNKHEDEGDRVYAASPAQLRKLEAIFSEKSPIEDETARNDALDRLIYKKFGCVGRRGLVSTNIAKAIKLVSSLEKKNATTNK